MSTEVKEKNDEQKKKKNVGNLMQGQEEVKEGNKTSE